MSKPNSRSFRYSDKVAEILSGFQGSSMNDKFENLVLYCFDNVERKKKEIEHLDWEIQRKRKKYYDMCGKLSKVEDIIQTLGQLQRFGDLAAQKAEAIAKEFEE